MRLFISDLHLNPAQPETTEAFRRFLAGPAKAAETLWILGDLYNYWTGDGDLQDAFNASVAEDIRALVHSGVKVRIIPGNRDFMLSRRFGVFTGASIEPEIVTFDLDGKTCVVAHGDELCTDDLPYQRYRRISRLPVWKFLTYLTPEFIRQRIATRIRSNSVAKKKVVSRKLMDVNQQAVMDLLRKTGASYLIHGHTHMPACHPLEVDGRACQRWVLSDWHDKATWLEAGPGGLLARTEE